MPANLENSAAATGLEKVSFHSNPKERQCQRMFKLLHNCTHFTCQQSNAQNSPSQASTACEPRTPRCLRWIQKRHRDQTANIHWIIEKTRKFQKNTYFCFIDYAKASDYMDHNKLWKILKDMGIPDHLTCLLRNLQAGQESTVRTRCGTMDWLKTGTGVCQGCILTPCLFNIYAEYIMRNAGLEEARAGIKIAWRNIKNLRYADDTMLNGRKRRGTKKPLDESERGE